MVHEAFLDSSMGGVVVYQVHMDAGHEPGSFWEKLPKVLARHLVQNSTEHMGGLLGEVPGLKRMFEGMTETAREELMKRALLRTAIEKMGVDRAMKFLAARNEKMGMHNTVEEIGEIYLGAGAEAASTGEGHAPTFEELLGYVVLEGPRGQPVREGTRGDD